MIQFEGRQVKYDYADLNEVALAWSISIHKSQGIGVSRGDSAIVYAALSNVESQPDLHWA